MDWIPCPICNNVVRGEIGEYFDRTLAKARCEVLAEFVERVKDRTEEDIDLDWRAKTIL